MVVETLLAKLQKARYFEGYSEPAITKATKAIRKRFDVGMAGPQKEYFEKFPGLSLVVTDVDQEMMGRDDLRLVLRQFGRASSGMFEPEAIRIRRKKGEDRYGLEFTVNGRKYAWFLEDDTWIPNAFFDQLDKVTAHHCSKLMFHAVAYPDPGQSGFYLWCTARAFKAISRAGLVPSNKNPLHPAAAKPPEEPAQLVVASKELPEFPPPADLDRAERLKLHPKGRWRIPKLSQKTLARWNEFAASKTTLSKGDELASQTQQTFDLVCARHCGLTGVGDATLYAKQVVALVDRYLFGSWQIGYVDDDGIEFTKATARKQLYWSLQLETGCAVAITLGDQRSLGRFLEYICDDVYSENLEVELAFYRLLSDVVLKRNKWDWTKQADVIATAYDDRFRRLLRCLEGIKTDDEALFQKAIRKFGTKPILIPPPWFRAVVDCEVTILAELARRKGWHLDEFPPHLQDRILDRRLFD